MRSEKRNRRDEDHAQSLLDHPGQVDEEDDCCDYETWLEQSGVSTYSWIVVLVCGVGNAVDAVELMSLSYILPEIKGQFPVWIEGALSAAVFVGMLLGGLAGGSLCDNNGRRPILMAAMMMNAVFTVIFGMVSNAEFLVLLRFLTGFGVGSGIPVTFTLAAEVVPSGFRGGALSVVATFWMVGSLVVATMAWLLIPPYGWHVFAMSCSIPAWACAILVFFLVYESPRYLLTQGRLREAEDVIQKINAINGHEGRPARLKPLSSSEESTENFAQQFSKLLKPPLRGRFLLLSAVWLGICFGWYGLVLWIPTLLKKYGTQLCWDNSDDKVCLYQSSLLVASASIPGNILTILCVDFLGRNRLLAGSMIISSLLAVLASQLSNGNQVGIVFCVFNGVSVIGWNVLDVLSTEMFPTILRGSAMGVLTGLGRISAGCAQMVFSVVTGPGAMMLSALLLFLAACSSSLLPDLSNTSLDDAPAA